MGSRLKVVAVHGRQDFLQLQGDVPIAQPLRRRVPPDSRTHRDNTAGRTWSAVTLSIQVFSLNDDTNVTFLPQGCANSKMLLLVQQVGEFPGRREGLQQRVHAAGQTVVGEASHPCDITDIKTTFVKITQDENVLHEPAGSRNQTGFFFKSAEL